MHPFLQIHHTNTTGRDFVVSDLHGCFEAFQKLLKHVGFHPASDRMFSVGDLVDRGPHSLQCLELLAKPWFFASLGNHEQILLQHLRQPMISPAYDEKWLNQECRSMTERQVFAGRFVPLLERLPYILYINDPRFPFYVLHAELLESRASVTQQMVREESFSNFGKTKQRLLWGRALMEAYDAGRPVRRAHDASLPLIYCGHTIVDEPIQLARQVYLDGGGYKAFEDPKKHREACVRLIDIKDQRCWACFPHTGEIVEQKIWTPATL